MEKQTSASNHTYDVPLQTNLGSVMESAWFFCEPLRNESERQDVEGGPSGRGRMAETFTGQCNRNIPDREQGVGGRLCSLGVPSHAET